MNKQTGVRSRWTLGIAICLIGIVLVVLLFAKGDLLRPLRSLSGAEASKVSSPPPLASGGQTPTQNRDAASVNTTSPTTTTRGNVNGLTIPYITYTDPATDFHFDYPDNFVVNRNILQGEVFLGVDVEEISSQTQADGDCGTASRAVYEEQQVELNSARDDANFDVGFSKTDFAIVDSRVVTNAHGVKIAYGISVCGAQNEVATLPLEYHAITFFNGRRISIRIVSPEQIDSNLVYSVADQVSAGTFRGRSQDVYNQFLLIISSFRFEKN